MDSIKAFFNKKKQDIKFSGLGEGVQLNAEPSVPKATASQPLPERKQPTQASNSAAQAALTRLEAKNAPKPKYVPKPATPVGTSSAEAKRTTAVPSNRSDEKVNEPVVQVEIPLNPLDPTFIRMLEEDPIAKCVYNVVAHNKDTYAACFALLSRYIDNILKNPNESKYRRIKVQNKMFQEKVLPVEGANSILEACGFVQSVEVIDAGNDEFFFILLESAETSLLEVVKATMESPPKPPIDRCTKVFEPSANATNNWHLTDAFFVLTKEDIIARQSELKQTTDTELTLRTKAMRENKPSKGRSYRMTCVRIRMPDGLMLQGHFRIHEPMSRVIDFIRGSLVDPPAPFRLMSHPDRRLLDENLAATLTDIGLVPSALINLKWEGEDGCLLPSLLETIQPLL